MKSAIFAMKYYSHLIPFSSRNPEIPISTRFLSSAVPLPSNDFLPRNVYLSLMDWFRSTSIDQFDSIFKALKDSNEKKVLAISPMEPYLSEQFVLQGLSYGNDKYDVLSCLKFFDWAGRQNNFSHTRATFHSIFRILSRAKLTRVMLDFLNSYERKCSPNSGHIFRSTLVLGYTLAGHIPLALQQIGKMHFLGLDIDRFCYNILLHAMLDEGYCEAAESILSRITAGNNFDKMTHSIVVKSLCKTRRLSEAETYIRCISSGQDNGYGLSTLIDILCQFHLFTKAWSLIQEFRASGRFIMHPSYRVWIKNLTRIGFVDDALKFLDTVEREECFVVGASAFNVLLFALLKQNRVRDVFNLLMKMQENGISPNQSTLSAAFCFLCKFGVTDASIYIKEWVSEFSLSPNLITYSYLISTLCEEGNTRDAWKLLESLIKRGVHPHRSSFSNLGRALCRQREFHMMKEILFHTSQRNMLIANSMCQSFIAELCRSRRAEEAYLLFSDVNKVANQATYSILIRSFSRLNRCDIASRLLVEMQENGFSVDRLLYLSVFSSFFRSENPDTLFLKLLETQAHNISVLNIFIEGAALWRKPNLMRHVYEKMTQSGIEPNLHTQRLLITSHFKNGEVAQAINYVDVLKSYGKLGKPLCHTVALGLCRNDRCDLALSFIQTMESEGIVFRPMVYECIVYMLCKRKQYDDVVSVVSELERKRRISPFIGNTVISSAMEGRQLYDAWTRMRCLEGNEVSCLYDLIRVFSLGDATCVTFEELEEMIEVCYRMDLYTYNAIVKWCGMRSTERACMAFDRMIENGLRPNQWSFKYVMEGFSRHGDVGNGLRWLREMEKRCLHNHFF